MKLDPSLQEDAARTGVQRIKMTSKAAEIARVKIAVLDLYEKGHTSEDACRLAGLKGLANWKYYKRTDPDFSAKVDQINARRKGKRVVDGDPEINFEEFSTKYLHSKRFRHQLQWIDLIEGREPRDLHPNQTYHQGDPDTIIINTPPGHAKSTTITMDYVTYKIVTNPEFRVVIISKTETMAKKFLQGIKRRLTNSKFNEMQAHYAPPEGFEKSSEVWSSKMIYFGHTESDQKDPNIEVLGIGQQIYGARADLIILDDIEDLNNAHQYATHLDYIMQDVLTRDAPLLVVGTRVAPVDVYSELLNPDNFDGEESDWTYLTQPVLLESADDPADWVTLWPYADRPHPTRPGRPVEIDGEMLWPKWDGERLNKLRRKLKPSTWALVYMQQPVSEDAIFTIESINGSCHGRIAGPLSSELRDGKYVVVGLDPATKAGYTAAIAMAVDRKSGKRYLLDAFNKQVTPEGLRQLIFRWTEKFGVNEWRIEKNAFQAFLTQDREINQYLAARGVRLREHSTQGGNKWDPDWGVSSLEMLFRGYQDKTQLLDVPLAGAAGNEALRTLKEQLVTWYPEAPKTQKTDLVMALWFAELGCRDIAKDIGYRKQQYLQNDFLSDRDQANRVVINIDDWIADSDRQRLYG